ncbi:class I SAM-dependent methyltransferase [Algiphilus sp.]|uniref:class I SAM-dependent methyltransferase n=1 Tax=Algiphilus sp. TaxID=1872431 RepID=UPI0025BC5913|nr:class I SAM-dependent methyltransferase [Algiphilus sp.]MCK5771577.1 class I SAM-dependent methyltransferase [Algiphilus sp.]
MSAESTSKRLRRFRTGGAVLFLGSIPVFWLLGPAAAYTLGVLGVAAYLYARDRVTREQYRTLRAQHEAALDARRVIDHGAFPLPRAGGWAASSDLLALLGELTLARRPAHIVELGSGLSTVFLAELLRRHGRGRITSIDHEAHYAEQTRERLRARGLDDLVTVVCAPIAEQAVDGQRYPWYDAGALGDVTDIDLLLVDGPLASSASRSRYPAVPILWEKLSPRATIVMDDADRADERAIVAQWSAAYPLDVAWHRLEKGAAVLTRRD